MRISDWSSDVCSSDLLHYLYTWTPDDNWNPVNSTVVNASNAVPRALGPIPGSISVVGAEPRLTGGVYCHGYAAYSHIEIGIAPCRARVCPYLYISVVAVQLTNKHTPPLHHPPH